MDKELNFAHQLVKGKIAETVFAQMYRRTKRYTVLEFGYEKVIPELVQNGYDQDNPMIETLRTAPDFAVIDTRHRYVKLVEVKYRKRLSALEVLQTARRMSVSWNPSYLFVATLDGFYFDEITTIILHDGAIRPLPVDDIPQHVQDEYLKILQDFEENK